MLSTMQFTRDLRLDINLIRSHEPGALVICDQTYTSSLIISPGQIMPDWDVASTELLTIEHLEDALAMKPGILLLGTGAIQTFPDPKLMASVMGLGIGLEVMNTAAACRTYNILASENRPVVAALII
jgi:uncharacterized protein